MFLVFVANKASEELAKVKAGLSGGASMPHELMWWFLLALAMIVAVSAFVTLLRRRRHLAVFRGLVSISEPYRIAAVLNRAVHRQANFNLEIFDHQHSSTYRGQVFEGKPGVHLILELSRLPGPDVEFGGLPAQIHLTFRPGPQEDMEHYQFTSHTLALSLQREKNWRVARVAVAWPKNIISSQRRDFLRIEPAGIHAMDEVKIYRRPEGQFQPPAEARPLAEATVMDISVGGAQLIIPGVAILPENKESLLILDLPMDELDIEIKEPRLHLLLNVLDIDVLGLPGSAQASEKVTRTIVRGNFSGRYRFNPESTQWDFVKFSPGAFQDLSHWVHAYQRYVLKKENRIEQLPLERPNLFPSQPPARPRLDDDDDD